MCGIVGYLRRAARGSVGDGTCGDVGPVMLRMLAALGRRGPDSAGAALYGPGDPHTLILRVKLSEHAPVEEQEGRILEAVCRLTEIRDTAIQGSLLRLAVRNHLSPQALTSAVEGAAPDVELFSAGHRLEIVKQ